MDWFVVSLQPLMVEDEKTAPSRPQWKVRNYTIGQPATGPLLANVPWSA